MKRHCIYTQEINIHSRLCPGSQGVVNWEDGDKARVKLINKNVSKLFPYENHVNLIPIQKL